MTRWPHRKSEKARKVFGGSAYRLDEIRIHFFRSQGKELVCANAHCGKELKDGDVIVSNRGGIKRGKLYHERCWWSMFV